MATVTEEDVISDSGNTPNTSNAFSPAEGSLLVVAIVATATVTEADSALTSSQGTTFTLVRAASKAASVDRVYIYVANSLSSFVSQTVTFSPADTANGSVIVVHAVSGITRTGLSAIRQSAEQENQAAGTPAPVFSVAPLTTNCCISCAGNASNPSGMDAPSGWAGFTGAYNTPTTGFDSISVDSGFTSTTVTWSVGSATAFASLAVEIDTSEVPAQGVGWYGPAGWV